MNELKDRVIAAVQEIHRAEYLSYILVLCREFQKTEGEKATQEKSFSER